MDVDYDGLFLAARSKSLIRVAGRLVDPSRVIADPGATGSLQPIELVVGALLLRHRLENSQVDYGDDLANFVERDLAGHPEQAMKVYLRMTQPEDRQTIVARMKEMFGRKASFESPEWAWATVESVSFDAENDLLTITGLCVATNIKVPKG